MKKEEVLFYCGLGNSQLGKEVLTTLSEYTGEKLSFSFIDFGSWRDSCPNDKFRDYEKIRGKTIVLFSSIYSKELMLDYIYLSRSLKKQYGAERIIAVIPFILSRRCDHEGPEHDYELNYLRMDIELLKFAGVDYLVCCTPHSDAMGMLCEENDIKINFYPAYMDFSPVIKAIVPRSEKIVFYSPDLGSVPRAIAHARDLSNSIVFFSTKHRRLNSEIEIFKSEDESEIEKIIKHLRVSYRYDKIEHVSFESLSEHIKDAHVVMVEDEVSSGSTANKTAIKIKEMGAKAVYLAFTHPVLVNGWKQTLFDKIPFSKVLSGNTIPRNDINRTGGRVLDVSAASVISRRVYEIFQELKLL